MEKPGRVLCLGDIHGALKALVQVLERCGYDHEFDQLIFLGDYVDGWGESAELIDFLIDIESQAKFKPIFLRGNHDEWCNEWLQTGVIKHMWKNQGGQATFDSYFKMFGTDVPEEHRKFFRQLHNYYVDDQNRGFVHGGFVSRKGLGHDAYQSNYYWDRDLWQLALVSHKRVHFPLVKSDDSGIDFIDHNPYGSRFEKHKEVFIGHTATTMWNCKPHYPEFNDDNQVSKNGPIIVPMNRCNVWNLDTGCGFVGRLTIMDIDTKKYWQSDLSKDLYPNEKGR